MIDTEVIIIGGGPAGSTCAWKLQQAGVETIILDKKQFPRPKLCAGWITPKVVKDLQLEIDAYPHSLLAFDRLHFRIHGRKLTIRTRQYSIRRYEFDHWLLQRAAVPVHHHAAKHIREENGHYIIDDAYRCKYLVGAGGTNCPVYRTFFAEANPRAYELRITTMEEEFQYKFQDENCYLWFFEKHLPGYSWYVPKGNGYLNVGIGGKFAEIKSRGNTIREHWDHFVQTLANLSLITDYSFQPQGYHYYLRQNLRTGQLGNAFIVGDAAGLATKDLGEGIGPAVESGILAANAIIHRSTYSLKSITKFSLWNILLTWRW
ncbi:MAG: NAD(P)/FAD-dependent oxidoreductase [candidate division KSB1 bacterium]|nr:NAD(P)/FAD-dependent oxidoreductase [candidate division KSB1 bacterium]MDZ7300626.1 NAD(P)/FAD-dependent oxidoreductase [candidate division KSB1 bacterium]MDZ7309763.1 NAD(P)/FAD-dependent oxidoreductase [candidate division KSB1 bacterium]